MARAARARRSPTGSFCVGWMSVSLPMSVMTAMAVITDIGNETDIHPTQKEPVGDRLALAARAIAYGEKIPYSGPLYASMKVKGDQAILSFKHIGNGLVAKGGDLKGFTIAGEDGHFTSATAIIEGDKVIVSSPRSEE